MSHLAERLRKKVSRVAAAGWLVAAGATIPAFGSDSHAGRSLFLLGALLTVVGVTGRTWCLLPIAGRKGRELVTSGPYSLCRNPLYLFSLIGTVGVGLATRTVTIPGVALSAFLIYYLGVIRSEERRLLQVHGEAFSAYLASVNALVPSFRSYRPLEPTVEVVVVSFVRGLVDNGWFFIAFVGIQLLAEMRESGLFYSWWTLP